jgi:HEPN domain-containing protein
MPHEGVGTGSPGDWMRYAKADLDLARVPLPPLSLYEQLCFHAQQAVEKSIKAVLVHHEINFPYSHDLQQLIQLLPADVHWPPLFTETATPLIVYAIISRYPSALEPVLEDEYLEALKIAEKVVQWADEYLGL